MRLKGTIIVKVYLLAVTVFFENVDSAAIRRVYRWPLHGKTRLIHNLLHPYVSREQ